MASVDKAIQLAREGFFVFPLVPGSKLPAIGGWNKKASRDEDRIRRWWIDPVMGFDQDYNIGISTSDFMDGQALLVVDIDNKGNKHGSDTILELDIAGFGTPPTLEVDTPSGGRHLYYVVQQAVRQGTNVLGSGVDIRSSGGFVVGPGSATEAGEYRIDGYSPVDMAPRWIVERCGAVSKRDAKLDEVPTQASVDPARAYDRGLGFIKTVTGYEGSRNDTAYRIVARLKDLGCSANQSLELLAFEWECHPPLGEQELEAVVAAAYRYGKEAPGCAAPEAVFGTIAPLETDDELSPMRKINAEYAYVMEGGFILQETTDENGDHKTNRVALSEFKGWHANKKMQDGKTSRAISDIWMEWSGRREYRGVVFKPGREVGRDYFNLWKGFRIEPAATPDHPSVQQFKEHALKNVCGGNKTLFNWLMGFFAHMFQRPQEKPLVALVFKGAKGTGKNALVERVGWLLNSHSIVADSDRYLISNFNSHMESLLFFTLDEAAWAGDKKAESKLKGLITGAKHNIERKGFEPYTVDNLTRVAIIGNEQWLVPATEDERRFAVFNVGEGRKQDRKFFQSMREGMEQGGYAHLLRYFLDFDLTGIDVNEAPETEGLRDQKLANLDPFAQWWHTCLVEESLVGDDFNGWPETCETKRFRRAFGRYVRDRNIRSRSPDEVAMGLLLKKIAASVSKKRVRIDKELAYSYSIPDVADARKDFELFIGHALEW